MIPGYLFVSCRSGTELKSITCQVFSQAFSLCTYSALEQFNYIFPKNLHAHLRANLHQNGKRIEDRNFVGSGCLCHQWIQPSSFLADAYCKELFYLLLKFESCNNTTCLWSCWTLFKIAISSLVSLKKRFYVITTPNELLESSSNSSNSLSWSSGIGRSSMKWSWLQRVGSDQLVENGEDSPLCLKALSCFCRSEHRFWLTDEIWRFFELDFIWLPATKHESALKSITIRNGFQKILSINCRVLQWLKRWNYFLCVTFGTFILFLQKELFDEFF